MKRVLAAVLLAGASTAAAGPLSDALTRHTDLDVAALRAHLTDVSSRCTLGAVYARRNDLTRAALYLTNCDEAELSVDIASDVARIHRDVKKRLRDSDLAMIEVVTDPAGMTATVDALPNDTFTTPATLYLPAGDYQVKATKDGVVLSNVVHAVKRSRGAVVLASTVPHVVTTPGKKPGVIDMSENGGAVEDQHSGPPPALKHKNMMPGKYQRGMAAAANAENPDAIDDPMVIRARPRDASAYWLGVRLGGGMFDDNASAARAGLAAAATARYSFSQRDNFVGRTFLAGRLDWSRRGGEGPTAIDVIGASAGAGITVLDQQSVAIAVLAQLRGDLRLASTRMPDVPVRRAGGAAAIGVELALPRTPFTAGLRFEQGLTTLSPGARDRAMLFELGVDWR